MSDTDGNSRDGGAPPKPQAPAPRGPIGIVKGGTTTGRYDASLARQRIDAEKRRAEQDRRVELARRGPLKGDVARLGSLRMINQTSPRLVLNYLNRDGTVRQQCKSEITMIPREGKPGEWQATFTLVCPKCVARGVPQGEAQMYVRDDHRKFTLDERMKGQAAVLEYHYPGVPAFRETVIIAGKVSVHDIVKCDNYNCDFRCRIENSEVREV